MNKTISLQKHVLVTGGTGFIGSVTAAKLIEAGYRVTLADNGFNSDTTAVPHRIADITGTKPDFVHTDFRVLTSVMDLFKGRTFDGVIHFAAKKAVGESVHIPLDYFGNNLLGLLNLLNAMQDASLGTLIFSSSATVNAGNTYPYREDQIIRAASDHAYGGSKICSEMIATLWAQTPNLAFDPSVILLRYFNPIGAYKTLGDNPLGIPNNLFPYIQKVAAGQLSELSIFGNDYKKDDPACKDGTCLRDYIHVVDLARGHIAALDYALSHTGVEAINLGSGTGVSVLELVKAFMRVNDIEIPYQFKPRRGGDLPAFWADATKAKELLGWETRLGIEEACQSGWEFAKNVLIPK